MCNYQRLIESNWKFLIILDACRYDAFLSLYKLFFSGNLVMLNSPGSCTTEWFVNTFKKRFEDVIYISANPYITSIHSSTGLDLKKGFFKINAKQFFYKVVDVWHFGWDETLGTVHPETITSIALKLINKHPEKRFIIHYLQPHAPYIGKPILGYPKPNIAQGQILSGLANSKSKMMDPLFRIIHECLKTIGVGDLYLSMLAELLSLPPLSPMDLTRRKYGVEGLRKAYMENLRIVLTYVSVLISNIESFSREIVVTSDHGEFLGEKGMLGHPCGCSDSIVRAVPWLKVKHLQEDIKQRKELCRYKLKNRLHFLLNKTENQKCDKRKRLRKIVQILRKKGYLV